MLPSVTLSFALGLLLGSFLPYFPLSLSILLLLVVVGQTILEWRLEKQLREATACFGCLLAGIVFWSFTVEGPGHSSFSERDFESPKTLTGRIIAPVQQGPDRLVMVVRLDPVSVSPKEGLIIRLTWRSPERLLFQGDRIRIRSKLRSPHGSLNPGGFDYGAYLERQGIHAVATVSGGEGPEFLESGQEDIQWMIWNQFDRWRGAIRLSALRVLEQPALGLYLGVIVGERSYLDQELRDRFMVTGTVHLLSISGSHLGLVAILCFLTVKYFVLWLPSRWLLWLSRVITPTRLAAVVTVFPVTAYACLAGAELATIRSLVMVIVALIATWLGYEHRIFHALSVAALAILWHDPRALFDTSFQLSFVSVLAIAWWITRPDVEDQEARSLSQSLPYRMIMWGKDAVLLSAVVTLSTIPLVAFYFNQIPWVGLFANVIAVPVMGILLVPLGLAAGIWQGIAGEDLPFASWLQWFFDVFVHGINSLSFLPGGEWHVASPSILLIAVFYGCLFLVSARTPRMWVRCIAASILLLILSWWTWSPRLLPDGDRFRVTFLDVSQGDSAVIEFPDGEVALIDGGTTYERFDMGRGVVGPYLWNRGIRTIDHVIATHPQLDHVGGLAWVLRHFSVKHFWGTGDTRGEPFYHRLQEAVRFRGLTEQAATEGTEIVSNSNCRLMTLNPSGGMGTHPLPVNRYYRGGHELNNRSIVTEFVCGHHRVLFTADVEQEALVRLSYRNHLEPVEVLKVPHHGAVSSLQGNWLDSVCPKVAVISVGHGNSYGHPAPAVVDAYKSRGISLYRTDRDGAVWITGRRSEAGVHIHRTREELMRPVVRSLDFWPDELDNLKKLLPRGEM